MKTERPQRTRFLPPIKVSYGILQNALKQERQFFRRLGGIFLHELHHGILNDIQRQLFVAGGEQCLLVGAPLSFNQKIGKFLLSSQDSCLW